MFIDIITNWILVVPACAWALAQTMKVIIVLVTKRQLDLRYFVISGGMPSAHSATVSSLATTIAMVEGLDSAAFGISVILAMIVMYDAAGLRQSVGKQAAVLNRVMRELRLHRPLAEFGRDLKEFIGHTKLEVIVGGLLGIVFAWTWLTLAGIA